MTERQFAKRSTQMELKSGGLNIFSLKDIFLAAFTKYDLGTLFLAVMRRGGGILIIPKANGQSLIFLKTKIRRFSKKHGGNENFVYAKKYVPAQMQTFVEKAFRQKLQQERRIWPRWCHRQDASQLALFVMVWKQMLLLPAIPGNLKIVLVNC